MTGFLRKISNSGLIKTDKGDSRLTLAKSVIAREPLLGEI